MQNQNYDFPVGLQKLYLKNGAEVVRSRAVVREDTGEAIETVSDRYKLFKHVDVLNLVTPMTQALGQAEIIHAVERNGAKLVSQFTYKNKTLNVSNRSIDDIVAMRVTIMNSYNTMASLLIQVGGMVLKCLNGASAFRGMFELKLRHTTDLKDVTIPPPALLMASFDQAGKDWNEFGRIALESKKRDDVIEEGINIGVVGVKAHHANEQQFLASKTAWDLYNAFTYCITHEGRGRTSGRIERLDRLNELFQRRVLQ